MAGAPPTLPAPSNTPFLGWVCFNTQSSTFLSLAQPGAGDSGFPACLLPSRPRSVEPAIWAGTLGPSHTHSSSNHPPRCVSQGVNFS